VFALIGNIYIFNPKRNNVMMHRFKIDDKVGWHLK